ncbi:MAG: META domain-containing protein, partial [Candidatus Nanopelagicales bacterium]
TSLIGTVLVGVALALSACGGGSSTGGDPQSLVGTSYAVTAITIDGGNQEVFDPVEISFAVDSISVATPCNGMSGTVTYSETTLTVGALASTKMACEPPLMEQDQVIADALAANPTWQVTGSQLALTGDGTVITADSTQP